MSDPIIRFKEYTEDGTKYRLKVHAGLHYIRGNSAPYFSLTAEQDRMNARGRWEDDCGGCCHDLILKHWPELAPLAALHMSDIDGVPSHGTANANYYANGGSWLGTQWLPMDGPRYRQRATPEECVERLARYLRIPIEDARAIYRDWAIYRASPSGYKQGQQAMQKIADSMRPRWKAEADAAIEQFGLVVFGDVAAWEAQKAAQA